MAEKSRRTFLQHASLGAAAIGLGATTPALAAASASGAEEPGAVRHGGRAHQGAFIAYVRDARSGDIAVMVGEREVVHHDPELATRLARIADSAIAEG